MNVRTTVIYDACVLYPAPLRSLLMHLALTDLFRARWTHLIHEEWMRNLLEARPDIRPAQVNRVRDLMDAHNHGALVTGFEPLITLLDLPNPDDRHVLAAAIQSRAEWIITFNLGDFPDDRLASYRIKAIHPDEFIADLLDLNSGLVIEAARNHRRELKNPPFSREAYLACLLKQALPQTVSRLADVKVLL